MPKSRSESLAEESAQLKTWSFGLCSTIVQGEQGQQLHDFGRHNNKWWLEAIVILCPFLNQFYISWMQNLLVVCAPNKPFAIKVSNRQIHHTAKLAKVRSAFRRRQFWKLLDKNPDLFKGEFGLFVERRRVGGLPRATTKASIFRVIFTKRPYFLLKMLG